MVLGLENTVEETKRIARHLFDKVAHLQAVQEFIHSRTDIIKVIPDINEGPVDDPSRLKAVIVKTVDNFAVANASGFQKIVRITGWTEDPFVDKT